MDSLPTVVSYIEPALEGTVVNFTCPTGMVLNGPSASTCMGNGEWEPNCSAVECRSTGLGLFYVNMCINTTYIGDGLKCMEAVSIYNTTAWFE